VQRVDAVGYNIRHFCQELIDHFRDLTLLKAVGDPAGMTDLAGGELAELRDESAVVTLADLQRQLVILLKAEQEMAHATFPRLLLEMALIRMASLAPVVPVEEIITRLQKLEERGGGGLVASAQPAWGKSPSVGERRERVSSPASPVENPRTPAPAVLSGARSSGQEPPASQLTPVQTTRSNGEGDDLWPRFVAFVKEKKVSIGTLLEHGRPLKVTPTAIEIGFPDGSYYLHTLREADYEAALKELARAFFQAETRITLSPLAKPSDAVPPSLAEKKSLDQTRRRESLKLTAEKHPMVAAALEIFGGELGEIVESDESSE
jgi:DNA polymerase-3 subunit gamma/tau